MKLEITNKHDYPLLSRTKVTALVTFEKSTPPTVDIKKQLAVKADAKPELVIIDKITQKYGATQATVDAFVYKDAKAMKVIESEKNIKKNKEPEAPKEEAPKAEEAPKEEAPKEEPKGE